MLPKSYRIVKQKDVDEAFKTKIRYNTKFLFISFKKTQISNFQVLIIVSKKIHKKANRRNKIRHRLSAILEDLKYKERLPSNIACIVQVKNKEILTVGFDVIKEDFISGLKICYANMQKLIYKKPYLNTYANNKISK